VTPGFADMSPSSTYSLTLIFVVVLHAEKVLTICLERDDQIQRYLISTEPPFHNYYNISKAAYPSVDLPSLLIKITVTFLAATDNVTRLSTANMNNSKKNETLAVHSRPAANVTRTYTWSISCLYVSGGDISITSMNVFSLWAIWPNRREGKLHLTLPQFCRGSPDDAPQNETMIYFLSTLQDLAIQPNIPDPRLNTAECVITGHDKASAFSGMKQLLHGVCWSLLIISLVISMFASQWLIVQLRNWSEPVEAEAQAAEASGPRSSIAAVMILSIAVFAGGFALTIYALTKSQDSYTFVIFVIVILVLFRRTFWCIYIHRRVTCKCRLTLGHETDTSKNIVSCSILYPAVFMACHHLLWIFLGIITEPFWGITVLVAVVSAAAALYFLVYEFHKSFPKFKRSWIYFMSLILILGGFITFLLLMFVLFVVAQTFLSESLISAIVQNVLVLVATVWFGYLKHDMGEKERGRRRGGEDQTGDQTIIHMQEVTE